MKKIIGIVCILLISTAAFADIIIQQDWEGVGFAANKLGGNAFPHITERYRSEFVTYDGLSLSTLFEFNSDQDKPIHFYAGYDVGLAALGFTSSGVGGVAIHLTDLGPCVLEMNADLKLGASLGLTDVCYPTAQTSLMFNIMRADRKGIYAGIGLTDMLIDLTFPSLFEEDYYIKNYAGMVFAAGLRF